MNAWLSPQSLAALAVTLIFLAVALQRPSRAVLAYAVLGADAADPAARRLQRPHHQPGAAAGRSAGDGAVRRVALAAQDHGVAAGDFEGRCLSSSPSAGVDGGVLVLPDHRVETSTSPAVSFGQILLVLWPVGVYLRPPNSSPRRRSCTGCSGRWSPWPPLQIVVPLRAGAMGARTRLGRHVRRFRVAVRAGRGVLDPSMPARAFYLVITLLPFVRGVQGGKAFLYGYVGHRRPGRAVAAGVAAGRGAGRHRPGRHARGDRRSSAKRR